MRIFLCSKTELITIIRIGDTNYYGIIYKITNTVNNKSYIGQTIDCRGFKGRYYHAGKNNAERVYLYHKRCKELGYYYNSHLLYSMEKYGCEAFDVCEVLDTAMSREELNEKEIYYIEKYDSFHNGYNENMGGFGNKGHEELKGKDNPYSTPICQLSLDGEFIKEWDSFASIRRDSPYCVPNIQRVCQGLNTKAYNYLWVYKKDYDPNKQYKWIPPKCYEAIVLLDDEGKIINEFYSVIATAKELHIDRKTVRDSCNGKWEKPTYNLKYKKDYEKYLEEQRLIAGTSQVG